MGFKFRNGAFLKYRENHAIYFWNIRVKNYNEGLFRIRSNLRIFIQMSHLLDNHNFMAINLSRFAVFILKFGNTSHAKKII